jgi:hypothetical protein
MKSNNINYTETNVNLVQLQQLYSKDDLHICYLYIQTAAFSASLQLVTDTAVTLHTGNAHHLEKIVPARHSLP